jgi:outer membrane biogenesis lipoprotein LolB
MKSTILALFFAGLALLILSACVDTSRQPTTTKDELTIVDRVELQSVYEFYGLAEPVNMRAALAQLVHRYSLD